jgi:hypothetical protein
MGQIEMKCISNIGKNISILAKATQVSDVAHGPLVFKSDRAAHIQMTMIPFDFVSKGPSMVKCTG